MIRGSKGPVAARPGGPIVGWQTADALPVAAAVATALPVLALASMGYARRWVAEDAFIDLRVVHNLLAGHGPVFNVGERVEAYTNPLWVAALAALGALGLPLEPGAVVLGLGLSAAGVLLAQAGAWALASRARRGGAGGSARFCLPLPLGTAAFAAIPVAWDFATSGLESSLALAWLGGVFWLLARLRAPGGGGSDLAALAIGCGPLVRPDLAVFSAAFGAALAVAERSRAARPVPARTWLRLGIVAAALPVGYQIFRMGYFAALVPNTALAKEATAANWLQGWRYTVDFAGTYALWVPLLLLAPWAAALLRAAARERADLALALAPLLGAAAHWAYVTRVGGDFMHGRLLLPTLFGLLLPVATVPVPLPVGRWWRGAALAALAGWAAVCAVALRAPYAGAIGPLGIADERRFYVHHLKLPNPVHAADYAAHPSVERFTRNLRAHSRAVLLGSWKSVGVLAPLAPSVPPSVRSVIGLRNVGILGYVAGPDVHVVDLHGLADPIAGRLSLSGPRGRPGHEKRLPEAWIVARFGEAGAGGGPAAAAAAALRCGELAGLLRAVQDPLTPARFAMNVAAAWRLHRLRIPPDPAAARDLLCASPAAPA